MNRDEKKKLKARVSQQTGRDNYRTENLDPLRKCYEEGGKVTER